MHAAEDGAKFRQFDLADAGELVEDLLLLELQLLGVGQVLPLAASADTEMFAEGGRAYITIFNKADDLTFGKGMFLAPDLDVAHVTRNTEGYENDQFFPMEKALTLGCDSLYRYTLKER